MKTEKVDKDLCNRNIPKNPIVSIIIPHRNSLSLLRRAVLSIPDDLLFEVIIVDNSEEPISCDYFDSERVNVRICYSSTAKGAGAARNEGLRHANGTWILFLDADDFYYPQSLYKALDYLDVKYDILFFKVGSCFSDTLIKADRGDALTILINNYLSKKENAESLLRLRFFPPCAKFYRFDFIRCRNIWFDEVPAANDIMFSLKSGYLANRIQVIDLELYCLTVNRGSITHTLNRINLDSRFNVILRYNAFLRNNKLDNFQLSVMAFIYLAKNYSLKLPFIYFCKAVKSGSNPFRGALTWIPNYISHIRFLVNDGKYIVKH